MDRKQIARIVVVLVCVAVGALLLYTGGAALMQMIRAHMGMG